MMALRVCVAAGLGAFGWTFSEYIFHRWFHTARGSNFMSKEHLAHHARRLYGLGLLWAAWIGVFLVGLGAIPLALHLMLSRSSAFAAGAGWTVAYFVYEAIHASNHLWAGRTRYGRWTRRHHFHHHFGAPLRNHGVTTPLWDIVFGTYDRIEHLTVPRRLAMVWLLDEHGDVKPEHATTYAVRGTATVIEPRELVDAFANRAPLLD